MKNLYSLIALMLLAFISKAQDSYYYNYNAVPNDSSITDYNDSTGAYTVDEKGFLLREPIGVLDSSYRIDLNTGNYSFLKTIRRSNQQRTIMEVQFRLGGFDTSFASHIVYNRNWQDSIRYDSIHVNGGFFPTNRRRYFYHSDGRMDSMALNPIGDTTVYYYEKFVYDAQNLLQEIQGYSYILPTQSYAQNFKMTYEYSGGKLTEIIQWAQISSTSFRRFNALELVYNANDEVEEVYQMRVNLNNSRRFLYRIKFLQSNSFAQTELKLPKLEVFPNPVQNLLHFSATVDQELEIYDLKGTLHFQEEVNGNTLNVSALKPGIYVLKAGSEVLRFVKR